MIRKTILTAGLCVLAVLALSACQSAGLLPGEGFVEVTGGKVWYKIVGSGEHTPLLVLHGGPGVSSVYLKPLEALAEDRPVIFYDQLGCGNSLGPSDTTLWTIERFVEEIAQVREALGLKEIHLYGHSWGTMLATDYMLTKPFGVRSLVLAGPAFSLPRYSQDKEKLLSTLPDSISETIRHHEGEGTIDSPEYLSALMVYYGTFFARRQPWSDELNSAFAKVNQAMWNYMLGPKEFTLTGTLREYDRTDRLSEITTPTLLTAGQYDEATPATVKYYQSLIPGSEIAILENCGHLTIQDDPETDIRIIHDFLAQVESK
jgi:proline iminopeptidase